jgi:hypothetical protein
MKTIIEMAHDAGFDITYDPTETPARCFVEAWEDQLEVFAELVAAAATEAANARANTSWALMCKKMVAAEKEACAKVCDANKLINAATNFEIATANKCADAIRARGQT